MPTLTAAGRVVVYIDGGGASARAHGISERTTCLAADPLVLERA